MALTSALKLPLLFLVTLAICLPTLYLFNLVFGARLSVRQSLALVMVAITVTSMLAVAFAPISLFFLITAPDYGFFKLLNVAILTLSALVGLRFLTGGMQVLNDHGLLAPEAANAPAQAPVQVAPAQAVPAAVSARSVPVAGSAGSAPAAGQAAEPAAVPVGAAAAGRPRTARHPMPRPQPRSRRRSRCKPRRRSRPSGAVSRLVPRSRPAWCRPATRRSARGPPRRSAAATRLSGRPA